MPTVTIQALQFYYETRGNPAAPPLLIISGITDYTAKCEWQAANLASDIFVVTFDNRGAGRSSTPTPGYTIADMADDAARLLDVLQIDSTAVFGFSMGGMIALNLALRQPRRVSRLILGCTTAGGRLFVRPEEAVVQSLASPVSSGDKRQDCLNGLRISASERFAIEHPEEIERLVDLAVANPQTPLGYTGQFAAVLAHDVADRLAEISVPTLVLHGGADSLIPLENGRLLADNIPGARFILYPGAGHLFFIERAAAVNDDIRRFLCQDSSSI
jgi:pimeloyl-ACP methyl ester carboxylesterase